jgi:hypothetical protein
MLPMNDLSGRQIDALDRVEARTALQPLFFRKLSGLHWFDELEKRGFFNPENNPKPIESDQEGYFRVPGWPVLDYLKNTAPDLQSPGNEEFIEKFLAVVRNVSTKAEEDGISNHRTWWLFSQILQFVPPEKLSSNDIPIIRYWLADRFDRLLVWTEIGSTLLPKLLAENSEHAKGLAVAVLSELTVLVWQPKRWGTKDEMEPRLQVDDYHASKVFTELAKTVGEKLEAAGANVLKDRLVEVFERSNVGQYSTIWRPAIEDHEQNSTNEDVPSILISAFRDSLIGYVDRRATAASSYIADLVSSEFPVFHRIAIFIVRSFGSELHSFLPGFIDRRWFDYQYQHEMYWLLDSCANQLSDQQVTSLLSIIGEVAKANRDATQPEEIQEKQEAYAALRWLSAVKGHGSKKIDDLYAHYYSITNEQPLHPDFSSYRKSGWVGEESPFTAEELLSREFAGVVEILTTFEEEQGWNKPTRRVLGLVLKDALKTNPGFFKDNLSELVGIHHDYAQLLLDGYRELWKERGYDNWPELLRFSLDLLHSYRFGPRQNEESPEHETNNPDLVVGAIAELLRVGTASDEAAFDKDLLPVAKDLIEFALEHQQGASFGNTSDAVTVSINSPRGKLIEALFNFALRVCRLADKAENNHKHVWEDELQPIFDRQVALINDGNGEFVTLFANYLPNLLYLSGPWTIEKLPIIFDKTNRQRWVCAMQGYTYVDRVFPEVYGFLKANTHFIDALDCEEIESQGKRKLIQNIAIAYLRGDEELDEDKGLLISLLDRWRFSELRELIWFIWKLHAGHKDDFNTRILPLWAAITDRANIENRDDRRILAQLCALSAYVYELDDEITRLIMRAAPYAEIEHDSHILVEQLKRLVDDYPERVGDIFLAMLDNFAPSYKQEHIEHILTVMFEQDGELRQKANRMFEKYLEYGTEFALQLRANLVN